MAEQSRTTTAQENEGNTPVDENWCHTRMVVSKHCYHWTVHDFCSHGEKMGDTLESSTFSTGTDGKLTWRLELCRDYRYDEFLDRIPTFSVGLRLASCQLSHVDVDCRVSVLDSKGGETATKYLKRRFYPSDNVSVLLSDESGQYFDMSDAVSPDDTVTIRCEMDVFVGPINVPGEKKAIAVPERQLSSDLGQLFEDGKYSDVVLNVQG
ncbi:hypothetical protein HPB48_026173 [Haemaphysalis longicornis]|uniref:MATH domain-containing protein n=1 Tax=Haemaphysalis longicornis TaxID=44386 RepID=A0A9J6HA52_HAELO|nr:hypothetical protein HPB48_026173 [Haemaphysalis longicornis]